MRWMNSPSVRGALEEMHAGLAEHDRATSHWLNCRDELERTEKKVAEAEARVKGEQERIEAAQAKLVEEGFLVNPSVYEPAVDGPSEAERDGA